VAKNCWKMTIIIACPSALLFIEKINAIIALVYAH
jgi:hypothetical protein